jgi:hypothetical protein
MRPMRPAMGVDGTAHCCRWYESVHLGRVLQSSRLDRHRNPREVSQAMPPRARTFTLLNHSAWALGMAMLQGTTLTDEEIRDMVAYWPLSIRPSPKINEDEGSH